jgi:hypothetical protein
VWRCSGSTHAGTEQRTGSLAALATLVTQATRLMLVMRVKVLLAIVLALPTLRAIQTKKPTMI